MPVSSSGISPSTVRRSERFLQTTEPFEELVLVSHVNPDPDALASMLGLEALLAARQPRKRVTLTFDGVIARAENQVMVNALAIPLVSMSQVPRHRDSIVIMVDTQPGNSQRAREDWTPSVVLDHHDTPGNCQGVVFRDIRPQLGATSTLVTGYLLEQGVVPTPRVATALYYGIETEIEGFPREASPADDGALVWLFPRCDKDLLAQIRNPRLPQSYFATFHLALGNAFLYRDVIVAWCGAVPHPDLVAELADFFVRFDEVDWALAVGLYEGVLKLSLRSDHIGGQCGEVLRGVVEGLGSAGGHDKRAGGLIPLADLTPATLEATRRTLRQRFLNALHIDEQQGRRLLEACPTIPPP